MCRLFHLFCMLLGAAACCSLSAQELTCDQPCDSILGESYGCGNIPETFWTRSKLTGDWHGTRTLLSDCGLTWDIHNTNFYSGVAAGGLEQTFQYRGRNDILLNINGEKVGLWTGLEIGKLLGHSAPLESVVFSSDGLRVLSASQDTTVRLWDIGRMTQSRAGMQQQPGESNASLGEVLSLEFHSSEATVAEFSPDGRTILTAGVDGKAVLWPSERIPPAIRVSNPNLTYKIIDGALPTGLMRIDANAVLCQPGTLDLEGAMIELSLEGTDSSFCKLAVDTRDGRFSIDGSTLLYHPANSQAVAIGALSAETELRFTFSNLAKHAAVEELIRHIAIQDLGVLLKQTNLSCDVVASVVNREGRSGNYHPERVRINRIVENSDKESESDSEEASESNESADGAG